MKVYLDTLQGNQVLLARKICKKHTVKGLFEVKLWQCNSNVYYHCYHLIVTDGIQHEGRYFALKKEMQDNLLWKDGGTHEVL